MNILHATRQFYPCVGGLERVTLDLCRQLARRGHRCAVATLALDMATGRRLPARDEIEGIAVHRLRPWGPRRYMLAPGVLSLLETYDLVHIHGVDFFLDYLSLTKPLHRKPLVLSTHGGFFHTPWGFGLKGVYFHTITRLALRTAGRVLCDSEADLALFRRIAPHRAALVPDGVDVVRFSQVAKGIEPGLLVTVGRIAQNKRLDRLIRALACLAPPARLAVVGPDWEGLQRGLEALARALGIGERVAFAGRCSETALRDYLARAHLFVSASSYEGFGLAVVEAMSTGTVPVLSRIAAYEALVADGREGFWADFARPEAAAAVLRQALSLDGPTLREMGERARRKAQEYGWERVIGRYEEVYREAMGGCARAQVSG